MAANTLTIAGATYQDVPAIECPKSGGGTASYVDVTDTTATAADVASGKYFYTAAGVKTAGTGSGGGGITITDTTDSHGGTIREITAEVFSKATLNVSTNGTNTAPSGTLWNEVVVAVPTGTARTSADLSVSGDTVTVPAGLYASSASASVASGTAGTPTATKGTVSNHSVSVTPSVTNTTGYITGSTKTGTAVTVSASELVSGSETKTANGTYDVTNLAELVVAVPASTSKNVQVYNGYASRQANSYGATDVTLTVAKAGTYKVSWTAWRGSSSGTMGTNLYINSTAGTNQQTWTGTYGQVITLNNQTYAKNDVLTVWATSGSNSRSVYVGNLIIEEQ